MIRNFYRLMNPPTNIESVIQYDFYTITFVLIVMKFLFFISLYLYFIYLTHITIFMPAPLVSTIIDYLCG